MALCDDGSPFVRAALALPRRSQATPAERGAVGWETEAMGGSSRELERRLDDVYRAPPEEFVEARDRVAKDLRDGGDREAADQVKRARKPTAPAWLVNRTSLDHPRRVKTLLAAAEEQRKALAKGSAAKLRVCGEARG